MQSLGLESGSGQQLQLAGVWFVHYGDMKVRGLAIFMLQFREGQRSMWTGGGPSRIDVSDVQRTRG
jgi:hypothetical protein